MIGVEIKQEFNASNTLPLSRITVPGLAEKRPSILRRDIMYTFFLHCSYYLFKICVGYWKC